MLKTLDSVLHHDDRCIDDKTDGDGEAAQAHEIGGHAEPLHHDERHERRERQRDGDHEGRA